MPRDDPSDRELFDDAVGGLDGGADDRVDREQPQRQPQPRDPPTGRWTRQEQQEEDPGDDQDDQREDDGRDDDRGERRGTVPSYRQRSEAERRRQAEEREQHSLRMFDQLAQRFGSLEEELRELRRPRQEQQQRQRPDIWRDPDQFVQSIEERFQNLQDQQEQTVRDRMINLTFRAQHRARGQEFEQAYTALRGMRGSRMFEEITSDADPGAALMEWYDGERMRAEIGGDPDGYVERRTAERLEKDPKFRRQIAKALGFELLDDDGSDRGREPPARNGRSGTQTLVRLPSVNMASGRGGGGGGNRRSGGALPVTDGDFFADAVAGLPIARMRAGARGN